MAHPNDATALLCLDFQAGTGDLPYATAAALRATVALGAGRKAGLLRVFSKLSFRPGREDVARWNPFFNAARDKPLLIASQSRLIPALEPIAGEVTIDKSRFSAFTGSDLHVLLSANRITDLVLCGVSTGGVVLATFMAASDQDFSLTVLSDACADPRESLHAELMAGVFSRSAQVTTVDDWASSLPASSR